MWIYEISSRELRGKKDLKLKKGEDNGEIQKRH
jgi:hypothetical protein